MERTRNVTCLECAAEYVQPVQHGQGNFCSSECRRAAGNRRSRQHRAAKRTGVRRTRQFVCAVCGCVWAEATKPGRPPKLCSDECRAENARRNASNWRRDPQNAELLKNRLEETREQRAAAWAAYYEKHRERLIAASVQWLRENPQRRSAYSAARHARTRGSADAENFSLDEIFERDSGLCHLCGQKVARKTKRRRDGPSMDHIVPVSQGGPHTRENVALAHFSCNASRRVRHVEEFRAERMTTLF